MSTVTKFSHKIPITTTNTLFENNELSDYVLIESLQKPYIYLEDYVIASNLDVTVKYNIIFKDLSKTSNEYKMYYNLFNSTANVDYSDYSTWSSKSVLGNTNEDTITGITLTENIYLAIVFDYVNTDSTPLNINFNVKFPVINIQSSLDFQQIENTDQVPLASTSKKLFFNFVVLDSTLSSTSTGLSGIIYALTLNSAFAGSAPKIIYVDGVAHYYLNSVNTINTYFDLYGNTNEPSFEYYGSMLINFEQEPYSLSSGTNLVFIFQPYYKEKYFLLTQESDSSSIDLDELNFGVSVTNDTQIPDSKPQEINFSQNIASNTSLFVLKTSNEINVIKI